MAALGIPPPRPLRVPCLDWPFGLVPRQGLRELEPEQSNDRQRVGNGQPNNLCDRAAVWGGFDSNVDVFFWKCY